jgi:hypothetical protein
MIFITLKMKIIRLFLIHNFIYVQMFYRISLKFRRIILTVTIDSLGHLDNQQLRTIPKEPGFVWPSSVAAKYRTQP